MLTRFKYFSGGLLLLIAGTNADAQLMTNNNISVSINTGAQLTVKGDITNTAGTAIFNNGTIDFSGNWDNNSGNNCFGTSAGTVILNGGVQTIGGVDETVFNNLQLTGTATKTLLINTTAGGAYLSPAGVLDVTTVALDLNSKRLLVTNPNPNAVTGSTGFILSEDVDNSSTLVWQINTTTGTHTVPFGNAAGVQIPFSFNLTSGNAGDVTLSTYPSAANNTPYPVTPTLVTHVRDIFGNNNSSNTVDRFWEIGTTGTPVASLTFTYAPSENASVGNTNVRAQRWRMVGEAWESPLPGQLNPTTQSVFVPGVNQFGAWALSLEISPLPVELLTFTAQTQNNDRVICNWSTASETNNDYFTVERSLNGTDFEEIGTVDGAGTSTVPLHYAFTDFKPFQGVSYYRLKQTDYDGVFSYSQIEKVNIYNSINAQVSVFPNPSQGLFYLQFNGFEQGHSPVRMEMYNISGQLVLSSAIHILRQNGLGNYELDAFHLSPGFYYFRIFTADALLGDGKLEITR